MIDLTENELMEYINIITDKNRRIDISKNNKEILCNSTGQALIKIFYSKSSLVKLFWIACLMGTCSLCAYFVVESLVLYFTPVSSTQVRTHFETM